MFLRILQNSQQNTCARVSVLVTATLLKKRLRRKRFPVDFAKILVTSVFIERYRPEAYRFINKETLTQMFSCLFRKIFKNTYFEEHL